MQHRSSDREWKHRFTVWPADPSTEDHRSFPAIPPAPPYVLPALVLMTHDDVHDAWRCQDRKSHTELISDVAGTTRLLGRPLLHQLNLRASNNVERQNREKSGSKRNRAGINWRNGVTARGKQLFWISFGFVRVAAEDREGHKLLSICERKWNSSWILEVVAWPS